MRRRLTPSLCGARKRKLLEATVIDLIKQSETPFYRRVVTIRRSVDAVVILIVTLWLLNVLLYVMGHIWCAMGATAYMYHSGNALTSFGSVALRRRLRNIIFIAAIAQATTHTAGLACTAGLASRIVTRLNAAAAQYTEIPRTCVLGS